MEIILFGSNGMIGSYVLNILSKTKKIKAITRSEFDIEKDLWSKLNDILYKEKNKNIIIVNCAGIIPQKNDFNSYKKFIRVNSLFPHKLQEISNKYNYKLIHITTDCVFNGLKGNYLETDIHTEENIYGVTKSLGEPENACIIRTSVVGEEKYNKKNMLEWVKSEKNNCINGFTCHLWNGVTCLRLSLIIEKIINTNTFWKGVRHIFSPNIVSKYDLCNYINDIYNLNISIVKYETKIINKSLNTCYNNLIEYDILDIKEELKLQHIFHSTIHILGKNSFIGNSLYNNIECKNKKIYSHAEINFFIKNLNKNDIVINCCGVNRGTYEVIYNSNYLFIKEIINAINLYENIRFINISSLMASDLNNNSIFSKSKIMGDNYIINNISNTNDYTILRLCNILDNGIKPYNNNFIYTLMYEKQNNIINSKQYNIYNNSLYILSIQKVLDTVIDSIIYPKNEILNVISDKIFKMHDIIKIIYCNDETIEKYNIKLVNTICEVKYNKDINNIVKECDIEKLIYNIKI